MGFIDDRYGIKKPLISAAEKILPNVKEGTVSGYIHAVSEDMNFDYANLLGNTWFNPDNRSERSNMNLCEITDAAQRDSMELIRLFAASVGDKHSADFAKFTRGINFGGKKSS
jgi:hypothetical protein